MNEIKTIRAHFDGKTIVPDEPVNLPKNSALVVDIRSGEVTDSADRQAIIDRQIAGLKRLKAMAAKDPVISVEQLRRENMYHDVDL